MFVVGKRLCDIVGWVVLLSLLALEVYGLTVFDSFEPSHTKTAQRDMMTLTQVSEMYELRFGQVPDSCEQLRAAGLVLRCTPDPWGTTYQLLVAPDRESITVRSAGPDREHGTLDDVFPDRLE
jgi:hypothetical protein